MNAQVIGAARVVFDADTSDFDSAARGVEGTLGRLVDKFHAFEQRIKNIGTGVTLGVTLPFAAMVKTVDKGAGTFEGQMKRVEAALDNVSGAQLKQLSDQARDLGPRVGKGATEAATGIEELGLAGLATNDILGGGLKATLDLAAAGMSEVAPAAGLVTDVMGQFKKTAADLPVVVQNVVGAMDASKFGFEDFTGAVAQGGGVAASAGISFLDFATAVAATSTQFSSGSDAGTSFKTYIQSLVGNSDEATAAMKKLGIEFFDAQGRMKPLGEQAAILRKALGDLDDASKTKALKTIFGSDAARTAIGLMEQGRQGFEDLQKTVAGGDVEAKIAKRLEGSAAAGTRVANAWESVKIALGMEGGMLAPLTAIKNAFAAVLETIAKAPPAILKVGTVFAGLGAALGPALVILGHVGAVLLANFAASRFGLIGKAIGLIVAPVTTIMNLLGEYGLVKVLTMVGSRLAAFLGPVGIAISAFLMFRDSIVPILQQVRDKLTATLGPKLEEIVSKVGGIFSSLSSGPVGSALSTVVSLLGGVADVIGTVIAGVLAIFGELLVRTLSAAADLFIGLVDAVQGAVDLIGALLTGDFAGAWDALVGIVTSVCDAIVEAVISLVPDMEVPFRLVYEAAKAWLGDAFGGVMTWLTDTVKVAVDYISSVFPNVVTAAKGVYEGVKGWLVDKFGGILSWVSIAAKFISDRFAEVKKNLGLGGSEAPAPPVAPAAPKPSAAPAAGPKRSVDFDEDKKKKNKKGRDTTYDTTNREELKLAAELEAARVRGDRETEQRIQDRLDMEKQVEAYQRTGLTNDQARVMAQRDLSLIQQARAVAMGKELADEKAAVALDIAQIDNNTAMEETLSRQAELKKRIAFYYAQVNDLAKATQLAEADQTAVDDARARARARWFEDEAQDRAVRLAELRGATEEEVRQLQRVVDIRERVRDLEAEGMGHDDAVTRATTEWDEEERARMQGLFRSTFKDGVRAALDGDLSSWVKNWWKDRFAKGMEEALNKLADSIAALFSKVGQSGNGSGGGILGALGSAIGGMFGGGSSIGKVDTSGWGDAGKIILAPDTSSLPRFNTGGSFRVGGMSGIDRNVVSMKLSAGEIVDIRKPGNDNGGSKIEVNAPLYMQGAVDLATRDYANRIAIAHAQNTRSAMADAEKRRG